MASMPEKVFVGMNFYGYDYVQVRWQGLPPSQRLQFH